MHPLPIASNSALRPELIQCGWQDGNIQLLSRFFCLPGSLNQDCFFFTSFFLSRGLCFALVTYDFHVSVHCTGVKHQESLSVCLLLCVSLCLSLSLSCSVCVRARVCVRVRVRVCVCVCVCV